LLWSGGFSQVHWLDFWAALVVSLVAASMSTSLLGLVSARFRDVPMIVSSTMQISFFMTPVFWKAEQLSERSRQILYYNPLAAFLDVLRAPLIGSHASAQSWEMVCICLLTLTVLFVVGFVLARRRIAYWV